MLYIFANFWVTDLSTVSLKYFVDFYTIADARLVKLCKTSNHLIMRNTFSSDLRILKIKT